MPHTRRYVSTVETNNERVIQTFGEELLFLGIVCSGRSINLLGILNEVRHRCEDEGVRLVFQRFSPARLLIKLEGEA